MRRRVRLRETREDSAPRLPPATAVGRESFRTVPGTLRNDSLVELPRTHVRDDLVEDAVRRHAFRLALEVQDEPVAQRRVERATDVLARDLRASLGERGDLARQREGQRPARARAVADEAAH